MIYLQYIDGNAKGPRRVDITARCLFIRGPHGSGKSALIDDLNLAINHEHVLLGKVPATLLALAPNHTAPLYAEVGFSDNQHARFEIGAGTTASATKAEKTRPDYAGDSIVHSDVLAFLGSSVPEMRRKIMRRFGESVRAGLLDAPNDCTETEKLIWTNLTTRTKPSDPPEERLATMLTLVRSDKLATTKRVGELTKALMGPAPVPRTAVEVTRVWAARTAIAGLVDAWGAQARRGELEAFIVSYGDVETRLASARALLDTARQELAFADGVLALVGAAGRFTACPLCAVGPAEAAMAARGAAVERQRVKQGEIAWAQGEINRLGMAANEVAGKKRELSLIPICPGDSEERCRAELARLDAHHAVIKSEADKFKAHQEALSAKDAKQREYETLQRVEVYVKQRIEWAVTQVAGAFAAKLTRYLPAGRQAGVVLHNEHRDACDVGLVVGGVVYPADTLGGRELGDLVVAAAGAFGEGRLFSVLVLDDLILGHFRERAALADLYQRCYRLVVDGLVSNVIACGTAEAWVETEGWQVADVG